MTPREKELARQLESCQQELAAARRENELLRQKIDLLVRRVFGSSSERLDRAQLELLLQLPQPVPQEPLPASEKQLRLPFPRRQRAPRLPEKLPVVEEVIDPEPVKEQPQAWRCIGQEVSEQLDYEPARFLRRRIVRRKYVHRRDQDSAPVIAALPERLLDRSLPAPGLLAHILISKYCDHLPLYRQEQIFLRRHRVHLPRQTLARWVGLLAIKSTGATPVFVAYDGNGNVTGLIDATTGTATANFDYGPIGETIRLTPNANNQSPFRFSTKYTDDESDFVYYGYRYYNPSTGRWLSRDPIGYEGGINEYTFCANDPILRVDVFGLEGVPSAPPRLRTSTPNIRNAVPTKPFRKERKD